MASTEAARFHPGGVPVVQGSGVSGQVEGGEPPVSEVADKARAIRNQVKTDPRSGSMLETAVEISRSLGVVLGYGLAVTVMISLLPESLLLALFSSLKSQVRTEDATQEAETDEASQAASEIEGAGETPDTSDGGKVNADDSTSSHSFFVMDNGQFVPVEGIEELQPESSQDNSMPPTALEDEEGRGRSGNADDDSRKDADPLAPIAAAPKAVNLKRIKEDARK